jgi:hypothetical protein
MPVLLTKAADIRAWEEDAHSPARSIARVLAYRIKRELDRPSPFKSAHAGIRTNGAASTRPVPVPIPSTPWDDHLRNQLGDHRWQLYAGDGRRGDIASLLNKAHAAGHDVPALINRAITVREWEDDPRSPSRQVGGVLHYRLKAAIASSMPGSGSLPAEVARTVASATAPAGTHAGASQRTAEPARRQAAYNAMPSPARDRE